MRVQAQGFACQGAVLTRFVETSLDSSKSGLVFSRTVAISPSGVPTREESSLGQGNRIEAAVAERLSSP